MKTIVVTGGTGRFGDVLKNFKQKHKILFPTKKELNILNLKNIKLIYFSTNYVYPGSKGNYKETDSLLPVNNYAWSKLGGEASVQLYKNSLILRVCMT